MKKIILFTLSILIGINSKAQHTRFNQMWLTDNTALNSTIVYEVDMKTDASGNIYHLGKFNNGSNWDIVTVKMNSSGTVLWSQNYNSTDQDYAISLGVDNSGNVYSILNSIVSGTTRMRVIKYNSTGVLQWNWLVTGVLGGTVNYGTTDGAGNTYISGLDGTTSTVVTYKISTAGSTTWSASYAPNGFARAGNIIAIDASSNVYVAGHQNTTANGYDWVVLKYNSLGAQQWVQSYGGSGNDTATSLIIDGAANVIVAGKYDGVDATVRKYTSAGVVSWTNTIEFFTLSKPVIQIDNSNNVYAAAGRTQLNGGLRLKKYSSTGVQQWTQTYNQPTNSFQPPPTQFDKIPKQLLVHDDSTYVYVGIDGASKNNGGNVNRGFHIARFKTTNGSFDATWDNISNNQSYPDPAYTTSIAFADNKQAIIISGSHKINSLGNPYKIRTVKYNNYVPIVKAHAPSYVFSTQTSSIYMCDMIARGISDSCRLEPSGMQTGYTYLWIRNNISVPDEDVTNAAINTEYFSDRTNPNSYFNPPAGTFSYMYKLKVTDAFGNTFYSTPVTITRHAFDNTVTVTGSTNFCSPGSVTLSMPQQTDYGIAQFVKLGSPNQYLQSYSGTLVGTNPSDNLTYSANVSGQYTFDVDRTLSSNSNQYSGYNFTGSFTGCNYYSDTITVTVNNAPSQPSVITGSNNVCQGSSQTYSITNVSGVTYNWSAPGGSISGSGNSISITWNLTGAQTVSVTATNSCGTSTSSVLNVTVNSGSSLPQPGTISGNANVCSGSSQSYSIASVSGATSYTWILPSGWSGTSTTTSINATAGTTGTISVTANNSCGSSTAQTLNITVNSTPSQPGSISGNTNSCATTAQTYSIASVAGASSYTWTLPVGWSGTSTSNSINATTGVTGGAITVTANNSCGISTAQTLNVSINPVPNQPGTISGTSTLCAGDAQTYSISAVAGATSYTWLLPSGWSGTSTTTSINATAGTTGGTISITANNACGSSIARTLNTTVNTVPTQPSSITGTTTACQGTNQTYSVNNVSGVTYNWNALGGTISGSGNSVNITWNSVGAQNVTVSATNSCGTSSLQQLNVTVNSGTALSQPGIISGATTLCTGDAQAYSIASVAGATSYTWILPSGWSGTSTTTSINTTAGTTGTISVTANNSCGSSTAQTLNIAVNTIPVQPSFASGSTTVCAAASETYTVNSIANATSYSWNLPSGWSGTSTNTSINATATTVGGIISVTASNGCGTSTAETLLITVINIDNSVIVSGNTITANQTGAIYQWLDCNNSFSIISGETNNQFTATISGSYAVEINISGCISVSNCENITVTSIESDLKNENSVILYPNPANEMISISIGNINIGNSQIEIYNSIGAIINQFNTNQHQINIDLSNFDNGIYFIAITNANNEIIRKPFVISK